MKKILILLGAALAALTPDTQAASVGATGYTNNFSAQPAAGDWSTYSMAGGSADVATTGALDTAAKSIAASTVINSVTADTTTDPAAATAMATWSSIGQYLQTRPTGNQFSLLMATLQNNSGNAASTVTISYNFTRLVPVTEEADGHLAYYSLTGTANSWVAIPEFTLAAAGRLTANLNITWPNGGTLYLLWADDNGSGTPDTAYQIDNFSVTLVSAVQEPAAITQSPTDLTVGELTAAVFTAAGTGNPAPTYQWYRDNVAIPDATNSSYTLASAPLAYNQSLFSLVAFNTVSNVNYSATSGVATLTVLADTNRPVMLEASSMSLSQVLVSFSEALLASTATNIANYTLTNAAGALTVLSAQPDVSLSNVVLTVNPMTANATYTLIVNGVKDRSAAGNVIATNSSVSFLAQTYIAANVGNPTLPGSAVSVSGGFNITGGGTGIGGASDQFMFHYQQRSGNFDVKVRVAGLTLSDAWAKAGLMARETINANSTFAAAFASPSISGAFGQYRATTGGAAALTASYPVNYPYTWLRLRRVGNAFTMFSGLDGKSWFDMGTATITMANNILVGFSVCASASSTTAVAQFRDFADSTGEAVATPKVTREPLGPSSRRGGLVITEIMYNPRELQGTNNSLEFVEIFNSNPFFEDISGFRLAGDIDYTFPSNTIMAAGAFLVVAKYPQAVQSYYQIANVYGPFDGSLPNDAGRVRLRHRIGGIMQEVNYDTRPPWPTAADGTGHSLVLARPSYGEGNPTAWEASTFVDGSPGRIDPVSGDPINAVVINEFLANSELPQVDFIELYNYGNTPVDISGAWLTDKRAILTDPAVTNKYRIRDGTVLPARGFKVYYESDLNFALAADGEAIILVNSNLNRVVNMVRFEGQPMGFSSGRYPDGSPDFHTLLSQTPGTNNAALNVHDIVINEIMYHPPAFIGDAGEYVELYNKGTNSYDLSRWRFIAGIDYHFPLGTTLAPSNYLVVAKNWTNLLASYPNLNRSNTVGNYGGTLANGGERLALAMPEYHYTTNVFGLVVTNVVFITIDEVTWKDGGRWGTWADRGGSSLELIDPRSDHRLAANWADSDETQKAPWTNVVWTELADNVYPVNAAGATLNEIQVMIFGQGEVLLDDVDVHAGVTGPNLVLNPNFETGLGSWLIQGNHVRSSLEPIGPGNPSQSLHIRASAGGDNGANRVECDLSLTSGLTPNTVNTIAAKLRWLRGHPDVLLRMHGGGLETMVTLPIPRNLGTPGARNSRAVNNAPPAIWDVSHSPVLPAGGATVTVTARVHDADGVANVQLRYRLDPATSYTTANLVDDGTGGDAVANDGIYSVALPAQSAGTMIAFYLQATDRNASPATGSFPATAPASECQIRYGDLVYAGNLGIYRMWMNQAKYNLWASRERLSNEPMEGTFVYNNIRAIYNAAARYRGSPFTRNPSSPTATGANFVWSLPVDDLFLGTDELNLDSLEPTGRDATALREITSFFLGEQMGLPFSYQRFVHPVFNGVAAGSPIYTDSQQPNGDYVAMWFSDNDNGDLFKLDDWFEFDDTPAMQGNKSASLENFTTTGGLKKKARYRWNWEKKFNGGLTDDYSTIFNIVDALNPDASNISKIEAAINAEQWMTIFAFGHTIGDWDRYGYNRGKNTFSYRPSGEPMWLLLWDLDFSLGCSGGHGPAQDLFTAANGGSTASDSMPEIIRLYNSAYFRRMYYRALRRLADGPLQDAAFIPKLDARYQALLANGVAGLTSPYVGSGAQGISIPAWIQQRRAYILGGANGAHPALTQSAFTITSSLNITSSNNLLVVTGAAPVTVKSIRVNGQLFPVNWGANYTTWTLNLAVKQANNELSIQACDYQDKPIAGLAGTINYTYTGSVPSAPGTVVFSEIMYKGVVTNSEYVEIFNSSTDYAFDLSNWRVNGLGFTFPVGSVITPRASLLLVKDRTAFTAAYPTAPASAIGGVFSGTLDPDGETLTLFMPDSPDPSQEVVVDRVRYEPNAPWPANANGQGTALQLIDHRQDNGRIINWSEGVGWRFLTYSSTNTLTLSRTNLELQPKSAGDIYIDDLRIERGMVLGGGTNLVNNGDFEAPLAGTWNLGTNVLASTISTEYKHSGNSSLHLVAKDRALTPASDLSQYLNLSNGTPYTVSLWYLPSPNITNVEVFVTSFVRSNAFVLNSAFVRSPGVVNPVAAVLPDLPALWLNEVQAQNVAGPLDNAGDHAPWLEIYNNGTNTVSLDGWYLANNYTNLAQWAFPAGTVINPGQFLVVWADGQPEQTQGTNLHASFQLSAGAGSVALVTPLLGDLKVFDYLNYTNLAADVSYGDYPDGQMFYRQQFVYATLGGSNNPAKPVPQNVLTINEWMASNTRTLQEPVGLTFEDWFELHNNSDEAVDLTGYYLTDNPTNQPLQYLIPTGYSVPAHGHLVVWADNAPERNSTNSPELHVNFQLSRNGEAIALYAPNGSLIDLIAFGLQTNDVSQGRYPDGAAAVVFMDSPTPGAANVYAGSLNTAPVLGVLSNRVLVLGQTLAFTATATDADIPAQTLTFTLEPGVVGNANLTTGGNFSWTPTAAQAPSSNTFTVHVTDNGIPPATSSGSFVVVVGLPPQFNGGSAQINGDQLTFGFQTTPGKRYQVQYKNRLTDAQWNNLGDAQTATGATLTVSDNLRAQPTRFYQVIVVE